MKDVPEPDAFILDRPREHYLHYGWNRHTCLGQHVSAVVIVESMVALLGLQGLRRPEPRAGDASFPFERRFGHLQLDDQNLYTTTFSLRFDESRYQPTPNEKRLGHRRKQLPRLPRREAAQRTGHPARGCSNCADSQLDPLNRLDVIRCEGHLGDAQALAAACGGVDTVIHMAFKVSVGGGTKQLDEMRPINIEGTNRLLDTAAAQGVARAVVASSALAVGVNRRPEALDETANWAEHAFNLPYATMRRQAEQEALARTRPGFAVVAVSPGIYVRTRRSRRRAREQAAGDADQRQVALHVVGRIWRLDVRDFAKGAILAAERGRPATAVSPQRPQRHGEPVARAGGGDRRGSCAAVRAAAGAAPRAGRRGGDLQHPQGKAPPLTRDVLQVLGRYAVVRHVASPRRPGMGAAPAAADARGHHSLAASPG